ncbi:hypothetical protein [Olsenella intestinalis]|uniref:hypothetical protein n=1 Tax=Olsenella intestinalis TaxID=2930083 RepID=UPI00200F5C20|nr:hypothetical protein [Olsenella intestinalis]
MQKLIKRSIAAALSAVLALGTGLPAIAAAKGYEVSVENHAAGPNRTVSQLKLDKIDRPAPDTALDDTAEVACAEGEHWEVPVLWVRDDLALSTQAERDRTYLPVVAFYVPEGLSISGGSFTIELSDSIRELFGTADVVSVFNPETGVTYILPESLRDLFAPSRKSAAAAPAAAAPAPVAASQQATDDAYDGADYDSDDGVESHRTLVDIHCSQTAREAFSDDDLQWLLDYVLNTIQPQAVNYLLDNFPSFRAGAEQGLIGSRIGLYIYFIKGDDDGVLSHKQTSPETLAYVRDDVDASGEEPTYRYMMGLNLKDLALTDDNGEPVTDPTTGNFVLVRNGAALETFENTMVHELLHAIMFDYNRVGMAGGTDLSWLVVDENFQFVKPGAGERYQAARFPMWFIEGSASAVENVFQFRYGMFSALRNNSEKGVYELKNLLANYVHGVDSGGNLAYFDIRYSEDLKDDKGNPIPSVNAKYVTGYLATVYLSDLMARKQTGHSAIRYNGDSIAGVSMADLRGGLDKILAELHAGKTLDQVIAEISPAAGAPLYANTADFESKFVKGTIKSSEDGDYYVGDDDSGHFVVDYLNYFDYVSSDPARKYRANGSILVDADNDIVSPLNGTGVYRSEYMQVVDSNDYVPSTVPNDQAMATGGKTVTGKPTVSTGSDAATATNASSDDSAAEKSTAPADAPSQQQPAAAPQASAPVDASGSDEALAPAA